MRALVYFTLKDLVHDRWRSLLTVLSLAVVVVSFLLLSSLSQAYLVFGRRTQASSNLVIISADVIDPMESSLNDDILQAARQASPDEILRAFPEIFRHMSIQGKIMQVDAVPLEDMTASLGLTLVQGDWPFGAHDVAVSQGAIQITPWHIGSTISIYGKDFQVSGILRAAGNNYASIWMNYGAAQELFGVKRGFQVGYLQLQPAADPQSVQNRIQADPRIATGYSVYLESSLNDRYSQINHNLLVMSVIQAVLSLLAITLGMYNANSLSLTERSHEIILLGIVGFNRGRLRLFLFARSLVLTLGAYGLGWITALLFINFQRTHTPINIQAAPLLLELTPATGLLGLALAVGFTFLGVWMTSGHISRLNLGGARK